VGDALAVGLGAAVVGALVNQVLTTLREARADRRGQGRAAESREHQEVCTRLDRIEERMSGLSDAVADVREKQAGISSVVNAFVLAPRDPRRGR
jgi:Flp pilus assembly protein TadB